MKITNIYYGKIPIVKVYLNHQVIWEFNNGLFGLTNLWSNIKGCGYSLIATSTSGNSSDYDYYIVNGNNPNALISIGSDKIKSSVNNEGHLFQVLLSKSNIKETSIINVSAQSVIALILQGNINLTSKLNTAANGLAPLAFIGNSKQFITTNSICKSIVAEVRLMSHWYYYYSKIKALSSANQAILFNTTPLSFLTKIKATADAAIFEKLNSNLKMTTDCSGVADCTFRLSLEQSSINLNSILNAVMQNIDPLILNGKSIDLYYNSLNGGHLLELMGMQGEMKSCIEISTNPPALLDIIHSIGKNNSYSYLTSPTETAVQTLAAAGTMKIQVSSNATDIHLWYPPVIDNGTLHIYQAFEVNENNDILEVI